MVNTRSKTVYSGSLINAQSSRWRCRARFRHRRASETREDALFGSKLPRRNAPIQLELRLLSRISAVRTQLPKSIPSQVQRQKHTSFCGRCAADQQHDECHRRRRRSAPSQIARVSSHCDAGCKKTECTQWLIPNQHTHSSKTASQ